MGDRTTSSFARVAVYLAQFFVRYRKFSAHANGSKPPPSQSRHHIIGKPMRRKCNEIKKNPH